jgi:hypothetical protein
MARHFKPVGTHAVKVLARLAARKIIADQLRDQGVRVSLVPIHQIHEQAQVYLEQHPELYEQALERARRMGWIDQLREPMTTPDRRYQNS